MEIHKKEPEQRSKDNAIVNIKNRQTPTVVKETNPSLPPLARQPYLKVHCAEARHRRRGKPQPHHQRVRKDETLRPNGPSRLKRQVQCAEAGKAGTTPRCRSKR